MFGGKDIMKNVKTGFLLFASVAALAIPLTGCGHDPELDREIYQKPVFEGELEREDDGSILFDNVEVTMWSIIGDPDLTIHKKLIEQFNDEYSGRIYINLVSQAHADYYPALETTWKNDFESAPDMCFMHNEKTATYANKGYLYPLYDDMLKDLGCRLDFSNAYENIDRVTKMTGVRFAVPVDAHGFITNFRADIILKNGLGFDNNTRAIPKSHAEYQDLLKRLKDKATAGELLIRNITRGADHAWRLASKNWAPSCYQGTDPDGYSALYANDGTMTTNNGRTINFQNNQGFKTYITDQVSAWEKGYFTNGINTEAFPAGETAMFNEGPWWASMSYDAMYNNDELGKVNTTLHISQDDVDKYSQPYIPMHPDGWWSLDESSANAHKWYGNGHIIGITRHATDINVVAACVEFMNWYIGGRNEYKIDGVKQEGYNLAYWCSSGHMPAWKNVYNSPEYAFYKSGNPTLKALGNPEDIIAMESHRFETTIFNALALCVSSVQDLMRAGSCTVSDAERCISDVVNSAQAALDMLFDGEEVEGTAE